MAATNFSKYIAFESRFLETLSYCPDTGKVTWRMDVDTMKGVAHSRIPGKEVGCVTKEGYRQACIGNKSVYIHLIAWFLHHGKWPSGVIDHINGDKLDNRISNLRDVSIAENIQNQRRANKRSTTGVLGVQNSYGRYKASIRLKGQDFDLGKFDTKEDAHAAYLQAKRQMHPGCVI